MATYRAQGRVLNDGAPVDTEVWVLDAVTGAVLGTGDTNAVNGNFVIDFTASDAAPVFVVAKPDTDSVGAEAGLVTPTLVV